MPIVLPLIACLVIPAGAPAQEGEAVLPEAIASPEEFVPLTPGESQLYRTTWVDALGKEGRGHSIQAIITRNDIGGEQYVGQLWITLGLGEPSLRFTHLRRGEDGLLAVFDDGADQMALPIPLRPGDTWKNRVFEGEVMYRFEGLKDIEVLGTRYEGCLEVSFEGRVSIGEVSGVSCYARGVGMVHQVEEYSDGSRYEYRLERHYPADP